MYLRFNENRVTRVCENLKCSVYKFLAAVTNATGQFLVFVNAVDSLLELLKPLDEGVSRANHCKSNNKWDDKPGSVQNIPLAGYTGVHLARLTPPALMCCLLNL